MRYTEYHDGVAVIKDKALLKDAMAKLAELEERDERKECLEIRGGKKAGDLIFGTCPVCGQRISNVEGGSFCQNCGQRVELI